MTEAFFIITIFVSMEEFDDDFEIRDEAAQSSEGEIDKVLRPKRFSDFAGQPKLLENLEIFVTAAQQREESLDHVLLHGPPGLGKTTLANIIANEMGVGAADKCGSRMKCIVLRAHETQPIQQIQNTHHQSTPGKTCSGNE